MKKIKLVVLMTMLLGATLLNADTYGKQNYFGFNPFGLLFNIYSGEYGRFLDAEGTTEINIPFYATIWDNINAYGIGAKYRIYKDGNGEGVFYGGGLKLSMLTWEWDFSYWNGSTWVNDPEKVSWTTITPLGELGYRWSWANGWTIAPSLELGFDVSTYEEENSDWGSPSNGESGLHWGLNLGVAYMF
ncbi:MAG: hypothetical protein PF638_04875 [Candidatus Delongbacteria bacterium]|jgi:hypothetical protein|nr:hypothetical protein [Candidatus Delongbacteria bacterium]